MGSTFISWCRQKCCQESLLTSFFFSGGTVDLVTSPSTTMQNQWPPQSLDFIMDTEDLPANNVPLTINEQVLLIQVIIPIRFSLLSWRVTKSQMYLNISSLVQLHAPRVWVFGLHSQHKQFFSGGEVFAESIAYAGFWADAQLIFCIHVTCVLVVLVLCVLMCAWHLCSL